MPSETTAARVQALVSAIAGCPEPVGKSALRKRVGAKGFDEALAEALGSGLIYEHPARTGRKYFRDPWRVELRIVELCGRNALTISELGKRISSFQKAKLQEAVRGLLASGELAPVHRFSGSRLKRGTRFATPEHCRGVLQKTIADLTAYYAGVGVTAGAAPVEASVASDAGSDEETVTRALRSIETRPAVAVVLADLRRRAGLGKEPFDRAVLTLARNDVVVLHEHDAPFLMSEQERHDLVMDREGRYYVGISWTYST